MDRLNYSSGSSVSLGCVCLVCSVSFGVCPCSYSGSVRKACSCPQAPHCSRSQGTSSNTFPQLPGSLLCLWKYWARVSW